MKKHTLFFIILLSMILTVSGCSVTPPASSQPASDDAQFITTLVENFTTSESTDVKANRSVISTETETILQIFCLNPLNIDYSIIPSYDGITKMVDINNKLPFFSDAERNNIVTGISFSELDSLGRARSACSCVSYSTITSEERSDISSIHPSGWHSNGLYNRSHLIMFKLYGNTTNVKENLITGFSFFNQTLMLSLENHLIEYISAHKDVVVNYRVTPVYGPLINDEGDDKNMLAAGVLIEMLSSDYDAESDTGLHLCKFVYNVPEHLEDYIVSYSTGDAIIREVPTTEAPTPEPNTAPNPETEPETTISETTSQNVLLYIANTNTKKFHLPNCGSVPTIKENHVWNIWSADFGDKENAKNVLQNQGYVGCKKCHP